MFSSTVTASSVGCLSAICFDAFLRYFPEKNKQKPAKPGKLAEASADRDCTFARDAPFRARALENTSEKDSAGKAPVGRLTQKGKSFQDILAARRAASEVESYVAHAETCAIDVCAATATLSEAPFKSPSKDSGSIGKLRLEDGLQGLLESRRAISDASNEGGESFEVCGTGAEGAICWVGQRCWAAGAVCTPRSTPLPIALLFPDEGSEVVGMLGDADSSPPTSALLMLKQAQAVLGYDLVEKCCDERLLMLPQYGHPALYLAELVAAERLRSEQPEAVERCSAVAGIGLGEFAALVVADSLDFEQGLKLVKLRAEVMQAAAEKATEKMSMLYVSGLQASQVHELCEKAVQATGNDSICEIAKILLPETCICAGSEKAILWLKVVAESSETDHKISAKFVDGQGAFQTSLMNSARGQLRSALAEANLRPPRCSVFFNSGLALPAGSDPEQIVEVLAGQLTSPILWLPAVEQMIQDGIDDFFELGPGRKLRTIMRRINSGKWRRTKCIAPCGACLVRSGCGGG